MTAKKTVERLNSPVRSVRIASAAKVGALIDGGRIRTRRCEEVNNHVHTRYSFSPYFPAFAAHAAWKAGLRVVGIMDHDSLAGAAEMMEACKAFRIACTVGCEIRVNLANTAVEGRKTNNPDSNNVAYMSLHAIPRGRLREVGRFLGPVKEARNRRNRRMVESLNRILKGIGLGTLDYRKDVRALSQAREGGSVTERHILLALASRIISKAGRGPRLVRFIEDRFGIEPPARIRDYLLDGGNRHYVYDLVGVFKSSLLGRFLVEPDHDECMPVRRAVRFANSVNSLPVYPYLGDVTDSPTGDKKAEAFEDAYLDELVPELKRIGFRGIAYMPPRNTIGQLRRVRRLCARHDLMEVSGVDINSSRQSFNCPIILDPEFSRIIDTTWALVAHEGLAGSDERYALFSPRNPLRGRSLNERIDRYAGIGRRMDPRHPEKAIELVDF